jgi:2-methylisocitrate lyase-like PEP mutase family enzyme
MTFKQLHHQATPLIICNVWDAASAKIAENLGFQAVGTSSAAIATQLGYADGEEISFSELFNVVKNIKANTSLPLSVDLESGYSRDPQAIRDYIAQLAKIGVVGINIEDSLVTNSERSLINAQEFADLLSTITASLQRNKIDIFVNARCDVYLLRDNDLVNESKKRISLYQDSGVDGIFLPGIQSSADIEQLTAHSQLPINVMSMPDLPSFDKLSAIGVKRISMGNLLFDNMYQHLQSQLQQILSDQSFTEVFDC